MTRTKGLFLSLFAASLIQVPALASVDTAHILDAYGPFFGEDFDKKFEGVHAYYETPEDFTQRDYAKLQWSISELKNSRSKYALERLEMLREAYPESELVAYYLGVAYNQANQPEKALLILDPLAENLEDTAVSDLKRLPVITEQVQAYLLQNQPESAYRLFQQNRLDTNALPLQELREYQVMEVDLLMRNGQYVQAYKILTDFSTRERISRARQDILRQNARRLGRVYYDLAKAYYDEREYIESFQHARIAYDLDPENIAYLKLSNEAHEYLLAGIRMRFQRALPQLRNYILNMRYDLDLADYDALYREYLRFRRNKEVSFVMEDVYRDYLPANMFDVLKRVEKELIYRGFEL